MAGALSRRQAGLRPRIPCYGDLGDIPGIYLQGLVSKREEDTK